MDANNAQRNENCSQEIEALRQQLDALTVVLLRPLGEIERKLDTLIAALAQDDEEEPTLHTTLEGDVVGGERDQGQPL